LGLVDLRHFKHFVEETIPHDWILRDIILSEPDNLSPTELCAKSEVWVKLLRGKGNGDL